jgi:hypothetical protein
MNFIIKLLSIDKQTITWILFGIIFWSWLINYNTESEWSWWTATISFFLCVGWIMFQIIRNEIAYRIHKKKS